MEPVLFFIGVVGNVISVLVFLSPVKTFVRIVKQGSTEEFSSLPYICTLLNACLWTYYGITRPGSYLVATVNGFGAVVEIVYVAIFLIYAPSSKRMRAVILCGLLDVGFLGAAVAATSLLLRGEEKINATGFLCSGLNIIMYASPLEAMKRVASTKSVEYMPFLLSLFLFLNGGVWTLYGILGEDYFLTVPNGVGFVLGTVQLLLYAIYYRNNNDIDKYNYEPSSSKGGHLPTAPLLSPHKSDQLC